MTWLGELHPLSVAGAGLLAGAAHALLGPDHLAGVAPLAVRAGRRALLVGVAWGTGHATGALVAAGLALALRSAVPGSVELLSTWAEVAVGAVLVWIGLLGIRSALRRVGADGTVGHHVPSLRGPAALGLLHGAAGLSHVVAVLPSLALPGRLLPLLYLLGYALASLASISAVAGCLGRSAALAVDRRRQVLLATSLASLLVGLLWMSRFA